nr:Rv3654c family TadE-like protein [Streptomyces clavifer]
MAGQGGVTDARPGAARPDAERGGGRAGRGHTWGGTVRGARTRASGGDRGLATVWVAMTTVTLCAVFAMMLALGQAVAARHRAGGAADLASLAAADRAPRGEAEACGAAREVAGAQGAELIRCAVQGEIADVTARVRFGPYAPEVRSRAGPPAAEEFGTPETAPTRDGAPVPTRDGAPVAPGAAAATPGAQIRAALNGGSASSGGVQEPRVRP